MHRQIPTYTFFYNKIKHAGEFRIMTASIKLYLGSECCWLSVIKSINVSAIQLHTAVSQNLRVKRDYSKKIITFNLLTKNSASWKLTMAV